MSVYAESAVLAFVRQAFPDEHWTGPVEPLSGGALNQVCRVRGAERSVVFKHAPPHVASRPDLPLDESRLAFEAAALRAFDEEPSLRDLADGTGVRPPRLLHHDAKLNFILIEDLGDTPPLDTALNDLPETESLGAALGRFIGGLHRATTARPDLAEAFDNRPVQQTRFELQYASAASYAETAGAAEDESKRIQAHATDLGRRLLRPGRCLVMGDLWPPSILPGEENLRLIDWEFAHYGRPLQDSAHLAAHCWMHAIAARSPSESRAWILFWEAFARAYSHTGAAPPSLDASGIDWNLHFAAEVLMRTAGPFRANGPFAACNDNDLRLTHARASATALLADPKQAFPVFWPSISKNARHGNN